MKRSLKSLLAFCSHIENQSDADAAYDNAFEFAVRMGWGYWRIVYDYPRPDSMEQEIYIKRIENPFMVYFDPNSNEPDGSDAEKCLITEVISKESFRKMYPGADDGGGFNPRGTGDSQSEWITKEDICIAEYFYVCVERKPDINEATEQKASLQRKPLFKRLELGFEAGSG